MFLGGCLFLGKGNEPKIKKGNYIKLKSFCPVKKTINKLKRKPSEWEKIFANDISTKGLTSRYIINILKYTYYIYIYIKNSYNSTSKENNPIKNEQRSWINTSPKETYKWPTDTWKYAQRYQLSEKRKSKLQWDITSHLSQ